MGVVLVLLRKIVDNDDFYVKCLFLVHYKR